MAAQVSFELCGCKCTLVRIIHTAEETDALMMILCNTALSGHWPLEHNICENQPPSSFCRGITAQHRLIICRTHWVPAGHSTVARHIYGQSVFQWVFFCWWWIQRQFLAQYLAIFISEINVHSWRNSWLTTCWCLFVTLCWKTRNEKVFSVHWSQSLSVFWCWK